MEFSSRKQHANKKGGAKVKGKARSRQSTAPTGNQARTGPDDGIITLRHQKPEDRSVNRTFSSPGVILSTAGGLITLNPVSSQQIITALGTEFTNFAQEFQSFRILRLRVHFLPATTSATSTTGPYQGGLLVAPWSQLVPSAISTLQQSSEKVIFSTLNERIIQTRNVTANSHLWNVTGTALPADRDFGLAWTNVGTLAASSTIFVTSYELDVVFRMEQ
jgi:hypothetical protein